MAGCCGPIGREGIVCPGNSRDRLGVILLEKSPVVVVGRLVENPEPAGVDLDAERVAVGGVEQGEETASLALVGAHPQVDGAEQGIDERADQLAGEEGGDKRGHGIRRRRGRRGG
jgi:hypothetical protein